MRRFKISVDGVAYVVSVEELDDAETATGTAELPVDTTPPARSIPSDLPPPSHQPRRVGSGQVASPLAGTVIEVIVSAGQIVKSGEPLLVLEAMKMESKVVAPMDGRVQNIAVVPGQSVQEGHILVTLTPA